MAHQYADDSSSLPDAPMCASPCSCSFEHPGSTGSNAADYTQAHQDLHSCTWPQFAEYMQLYMVAAAAKDCSVMITLSRTSVDGNEEHDGSLGRHTAAQSTSDQITKPEACSACLAVLQAAKAQMAGQLHEGSMPGVQHTCVHSLSIAGQDLQYRVGVVDFDRKPLRKVQKHWELDDHIVKCYLNVVNKTQNGARAC